jgi:RNA polymerase sigma-70 factor (ECF subfamily)
VSTPVQEAILVVLAQCGDREALESVLRGAQPSLHRYIKRMAGPEFADDVLQETLITIARKLKWLSEPRLFRAWAFRIASRHAFRYLRKEKHRRLQDSSEDLLATIPIVNAPLPEEWVRSLLESDVLSPASRAVLALHFEEGLTLPEVAAVLEIPVGTAKSRLAYGLTILRRHFGVEKESFE